jgi:hypothetical protein
VRVGGQTKPCNKFPLIAFYPEVEWKIGPGPSNGR